MAATGSGRPEKARYAAGGLVWLTTAQFFVVQALVQHGWKGSRPYSLRRSWISDLGATTCGTYSGGGGIVACSPRHALLNAGLVLLGGQVLLGAVLLRPLLGRGRAAAAALPLLAVAALALPFVAAFPEDTGKPWHALAATVHLAAAGLGMLAVGLALHPSRKPWQAGVTLAAGGISLLGTLVTGAGLGGSIGKGAVERLAAWPFTGWTALAGLVALITAAARRVDR